MSEQEEDQRLAELLEEKGAGTCRGCGRRIDRGDVAWNQGQTEAGTGYSMVEIICQGCDTEVVHIDSWFSAETLEDVIGILEREDWEATG